VVPASGGGVWLVDKVGRYAKLDADLARADPPGFVARVLAAVRGDQVQASGHSSEAADGIDDAFVWSATERRAALPWALLGAPAALAAFGALRRRWPRTARAACLVWLAGMAVLAEGLLSALEKL
jgi:hypothetical protein